MTILEHCHRSECTQVVDALQRRIAELEAEKDAWQGRFYVVEGKVEKLEQALDVALEALEKHSTSLLNHEDEYAEAIAKLKEVRRD